MTLTNDACPESCRNNVYQYFYASDGSLEVRDQSGSVISSTNVSAISGLSGTFDYSSSDTNQIYSIGFSGFTFTSNYECSSQLSGVVSNCVNPATRRNLGTGRRDLSSSGTISNPVMCIETGQSLLFDIDSSTKSYPVYVSSSLLNTNTNFDYGDFLTLASQVEGGSTITQFIFKFDTEGVYVFENNGDSNQQMVLGVMGDTSRCSDNGEYISPTSLKSLLLIGASESDVVYEPDWLFICLLLLAIMILIGIMIGVYYYLRRSWLTKSRRNIKYRKLNMTSNEVQSIRADNACFEYMQRNKDERILKRMNQKMNRDIRYSEIEDIRIRLKNHIDKLKGNLFGGIDDDYTKDIELNLKKDSNKDNLLLELQKLKDLISDHKKHIQGEFDENYSEDDEPDKDEKDQKKINLKFLGDALAASKKLGQENIIEEGNKQDDDELNKMMMQMQKRKNKIDQEIGKDLDDQIKTKLNRKLQDLDEEVDGDVRKKLLEELKGKLERVDDTLKNEEMTQKNALEAKLAQRKKKRGKIVDDYAQLQREKYELNDNSALRNKIDQDVEHKIDEMEEELEKERLEGLDIIGDNIRNMKRNKLEAFENKLRKGQGDKKNFDKYLDEYSRAEKNIQDELRQEQMDQENKLNDELRKRRDARLAKIEAQKGEMVEDAKKDISEKLRDLEEKERAFEGLKIKDLDPFLKDIVKKSEQKAGNKRHLDLIREEADKALEKFRNAEAEERERIRQELMDKYSQEDAEEDEEILKFREQLLKEIMDKEEEKEDKLSKLKNQINTATTAEDKQKIIEQHNQYKNDIEEELQRMANDGTNKLKQRLRDRRAKRKAEEDQILKQRMGELDQEKQDEEDNGKKNYDEFRETNEEKTVEEIVRNLQASIPKEEVPTALEKILDDRQMRELVDLLMRQYEEKAQAMKDALIKMMEDKTNDIDDMNKEYSQARQFLRDAYEKGGISQEAFEDEINKLKEKQKQMMDAIDEKYNNLEVETEQDIRRNFIEKHTNEQIALEEKHMREREKFFSKLLPESAMKRILKGYEELNDDEINELIREKNEEKEARIRELEEMMANLKSEIDGYQNEIDDLDEYERKLREKELLAQRRFDIRKQKLLDEKKRQQEAELIKANSKDQRAEMIKNHLQELEDLKIILEKERKRQLEIHEQQFNKKREAIEAKRRELQEKIAEEKRKKMQKIEEEQKRIQEMSENEKKRQEKMLKLQKKCFKEFYTYDKPAYSSQIDWADRLYKPKKKDGISSAINDALNGNTKMVSKEEKVKQKIQSIQKYKKRPMSFELLARIQTLEEIVTSMKDQKYAKVLEEFPEL